MASLSHSGLEGSSSSSSTARPESDENPEESAPVVSLLDRLKAPKASEFARNRKVYRNPPPKGKRRTRGAIVASDPKSVSAAASEDVSPDLCPLEFWRRHKVSLPSWASAVCKVILVQPSSAASERVFSILN